MIRGQLRGEVRATICVSLALLCMLVGLPVKASERVGSTWWIQQEAIDPAHVAEYEQTCREFLKAVSSTVPSEIYALRGKNSVYTYLATGPEAALATLQRLGRDRAQGLARRGLIVPQTHRDWTVVELGDVSYPPSGGKDDLIFYRLTFLYPNPATEVGMGLGDGSDRGDDVQRAVQRVADRNLELSGGLTAFSSSPASRPEFFVVGEGVPVRDQFVALGELQSVFLDFESADSDDDDSVRVVVIEGVAYPQLSFPDGRSLAQAMWPSDRKQSESHVASAARSQQPEAEPEGSAARDSVAEPVPNANGSLETSSDSMEGGSLAADADRQDVARIVPREPFPLPSQEPVRPAWRSESIGQPSGVVPLEPLPREPMEEDPVGAVATRAPIAEGSVTGEPTEGVPTADATTGLSFEEIETLLYGWAQAWSQQQVDAYLLYYSSQFQPPEGRDREQWASRRRSRVSNPNYISVTLEALRIGSRAPGTAHAEFVQAYRSDSYQDTVVKRLDLVQEDGSWRILTEKVVSDFTLD